MRNRPWIAPAAVAGALAAIAWFESRRPLRRRREPQGVRTARNVAIAGLTAAITSAVQAPLLRPLIVRVQRDRLGVLQRFTGVTRTVLGVLLLDYTLWWWHYANHRVPLLWRFHLVHHIDRDLDASTGIRFHFGEMSLSVLFRMAQVRLLGVDANALSMWQTLLFMSIFFHHSNIRLSDSVERRLLRWVVTPRMHGIHHSDYRDETDSNWSSLLSWWDWLHGTMRLDVPQEAVEIGVPAYQRPDDVVFERMVVMPFVEQREDWRTIDGDQRIRRV